MWRKESKEDIKLKSTIDSGFDWEKALKEAEKAEQAEREEELSQKWTEKNLDELKTSAKTRELAKDLANQIESENITWNDLTKALENLDESEREEIQKLVEEEKELEDEAKRLSEKYKVPLVISELFVWIKHILTQIISLPINIWKDIIELIIKNKKKNDK